MIYFLNKFSHTKQKEARESQRIQDTLIFKGDYGDKIEKEYTERSNSIDNLLILK